MLIFDKSQFLQTSCVNKDDLYEDNFDNLLTKIINNDSAIDTLDIRGLEPAEFVILFKQLAINNAVESLILRGGWGKCDLTNENIYTHLGYLLQHNKNIKALTLYFTDVNDQAIACITSALKHNCNLIYFKLWGHKLSLNGELSLVRMLIDNTILKEFVIDVMSAEATLITFSQHEYLNPIKCNAWSSYHSLYYTFSETISCYEDLPDVTYEERKGRDKLIEREVNRKEKAINSLLAALENQNFSEEFIKITKSFCTNNFLKKEREIVDEYTNLTRKYQEELAEARGNVERIIELQKQYDSKKSEIFNKYNEIQQQNAKLFMEIDKLISSTDRVVKQREKEIVSKEEHNAFASGIEQLDEAMVMMREEAELLTDKELNVNEVKSKFEKVLSKEELTTSITPIKNKAFEIKKETKKPAAKKLDVDSELRGAEYVAAWAQKVAKAKYDTVIFSIGSGGKVEQQIPSFAEGLGRVAILNIDRRFDEDEMMRTSDKKNISINYLKSSIEVNARFLHGTSAQIQEFKMNLSEVPQAVISSNIVELMNTGHKVILLSYVSPLAPRIIFDKILKDQEIMDNYGNRFLFIHSYFESEPTILCSKNFIKSMISPKIQSRLEQNKYIYTGEWMPKGEELEDKVVNDQIADLYKRIKQYVNDNSEIQLFLTPEGVLCKDLSAVNAQSVISLLGEYENIILGDSDI